jgi:hypothetical protein
MSKIPKLIHKVLLLDDGKFEISDEIAKYHEMWLTLNPGYKIVYWDYQKCRIYLASIDSQILDIFDRIIPYSGKCDLFRYTIMYTIGGWYTDWRQIPKCSIADMLKNHPLDKDFYYFDDNGFGFKYYKQTCFIGGCPYNLVAKAAVEICISNVMNKVYGKVAIDSTACGVITHAINSYPELSHSLGKFTRIKHLEDSIKYYMPVLVSYTSKRIVIVHKIANSLSDENTWANGNDYTKHWRQRTYYKELIEPNAMPVKAPYVERDTKEITVSLYIGQGLFHVLRDEILPLVSHDDSAQIDLFISAYDPETYADRWRLYILKRLTKCIYYNGKSNESLSNLKTMRSKRVLLDSVDITEHDYDHSKKGSLVSIRNNLHGVMALKHEPKKYIFLLAKDTVFDTLTSKPIELYLDQIKIEYVYPHEISMDALIDLLKKTTCMIGVHGDLLANMIFLAPSCSVLAIGSDQDGSWSNLASALDLRYNEMRYDSRTDDMVHMDIAKFCVTIEKSSIPKRD